MKKKQIKKLICKYIKSGGTIETFYKTYNIKKFNAKIKNDPEFQRLDCLFKKIKVKIIMII